MKIESTDTADYQCLGQSVSHQSVQKFLHCLSGQEKQFNVIEVDHNYAKPWNRHPDQQIRAKAAKFLFMKNFPKHFLKKQSIHEFNNIDIESVEQKPTLPLLNPINDHSLKAAFKSNDINSNDIPTPPKTGWNTQMNKLWTKAMKILHSDRLARLSYESLYNETILRRNLLDRTAHKFRQLFASAGWDLSLLSWLNNTLHEYVGEIFIAPYHESMAVLRTKISSLIDKFYVTPKNDLTRPRQHIIDAMRTMLNNYKPRRINGSPLFLIVPNGPHIAHQMTSQRMKHWHNLFGSLGKVITISVNSRPFENVSDFLNEIRFSVRDKIKECKSTFNEGRPLVLVGFGHSSLVAAHCALVNAHNVNATICLGFPLTAINGFRGDLDDPLLETTVPTLFVIGQNSTMATLDDMEDFRERITKTETGLVVVGGANDRLIVSGIKKKFDGITQSIVDRCICDEIYDFVSCVLNPNSNPFDHSISVRSYSPTKSSANKAMVSMSTPKPRRKRPQKDRERGKGRPRKKPKIDPEEMQTIAENSSDTTTANESPPLKGHEDRGLKLTIPSFKALESLKQVKNQIQNAIKDQIKHSTHERYDKSKNEEFHEINSHSNHTENTSTPTHTPKTERHYGLSYGISELPTVISQSATRTGRQIRAPKSLDV